MKRPRISLLTLMLVILGVAIWSAAIVARGRTREIRSRLEMVRYQKRTLLSRRQDQLPSDRADRLALVAPTRRPIIEVDEQGVRGPADLLWRRQYVHIDVPEHQPCELRVYLVETDPDQAVYDPTPIPGADESVVIPPGVHRLRWDARLDPTGKMIHYGVQLDKQWVIRGEQPREWPVKPPVHSTVANPRNQIHTFVKFGGTELMYYGAYAHFYPLAPGSNKPTTELHVRVYELDGAFEQAVSE